MHTCNSSPTSMEATAAPKGLRGCYVGYAKGSSTALQPPDIPKLQQHYSRWFAIHQVSSVLCCLLQLALLQVAAIAPQLSHATQNMISCLTTAV
jgi:hypothetical protein